MRRASSFACCVAAALALGACGGPVASSPAPKAGTPVATAVASAAVLDPKAPIDAAKAAATATTAGVAQRQAAVQQTATAPVNSVAVPAAVAAAAAPALQTEAPKYESKGRRDPFEPLDVRQGSDRSTVATAKLTGIVQGGTGPMALVETSDGIGYILRQGDTLADGRVSEIGNNVVVFAITPKPGVASNRVVLKLAAD